MSEKEKNDIIIKEIKKISNRNNAKIEIQYEIPSNIEKYNFDEIHINQERKHNITKKEAIDFIKQSEIKMTVWQGRYENYYSERGIVYVDTKTNTIRTAFKTDEFDETSLKILEAYKNGKEKLK